MVETRNTYRILVEKGKEKHQLEDESIEISLIEKGCGTGSGLCLMSVCLVRGYLMTLYQFSMF
jgi:hypothetical protein